MFSIKITRRQFLKWLSASAAALGLSQTDLLKLEKAFAQGPTPDPNMPLGTLARVIWITGQDCGGCATTLLNFLLDPNDPDPALNALANGIPGCIPPPIPPWLTDLNVLYSGQDNQPSIAFEADIAEVVLEIVTIEWAYIVMAASGDVPNDYLLSIVGNGGHVLMMDGAIPINNKGKYCQIMDVKGDITQRSDWPSAATPYVNVYTTTEEVNGQPAGQKRTEVSMAAAALWLAKNAAAVVCLGTCNSYGGIPAAKGAVTNAKSGWEWINHINGMNKIIVNVPGCAPNPDWFVATVVAAVVEILVAKHILPDCAAGILFNNLNTELDHKGRPKLVYKPIYHDMDYVFCMNDPRNDMGAAFPLIQCQKKASNEIGRCMKQVGCNGWMAGPAHLRPDCPTRMWNKFEDYSLNNWCVGNNMPCQGCASPGFPDHCSPFYEQNKGIWRGYSYTS